jgi:hypothetical protein
VATRAEEKLAWKHGKGKRGCCYACRRDVDILRRNPERISEWIDEIAEVLHGYELRTPRVREHRAGRLAVREMHYLSSWGSL